MKVHFVDLAERAASLGELRRFSQKFGVEKLVDRDSKRFAELGLRQAIYGEEKWLSYCPRCCGVAPTHRVVKESVKFQAIADPTYLKAYGGYAPPYPVKSRIKESNEGNNSLTFSRAEIRSCKNIGRPTTPKIQTIKPVRP